MIPKIDFQIPEALTDVFVYPPNSEARKLFHQEAEELIRFGKKHEIQILNGIEEYSGYQWQIPLLLAYVVPRGRIKLKSFATSNLHGGIPGVVVKTKILDSTFRAQHILVHELCHVNHIQSSEYENDPFFFEDGKLLTANAELFADLVELYALRKIFGKQSDLEKDMWDMLENSDEVNLNKGKMLQEYEKKWDLTKKPLREYIEEEIK